jgi:uncharacterized membrane protein YhaH (DUF805 family)
MNYYINCFINYAEYEGRASRSEYWYFALFNAIISFVASFIDGIFGASIFSIIYLTVSTVPTIAVGIRRMHDVNKSGWYILIPIYNLVLLITDSTPGNNNYGPNLNRKVNQESDEIIVYQCSDCKKPVQKGAKRCSHCGASFDE